MLMCFIEMILKLFGSKMSFDSLVKYADNPDPAVIEYFRQETEKLKRQSKSSAKVSFSSQEFFGTGVAFCKF